MTTNRIGMMAAAIFCVASAITSAQPARVLLYEEQFTTGPGGWMTNDGRGGATPSRLRWSSEGFVRSRSPWWLDRNHESPGAGVLHLITFLNLNGRFGGLPYAQLDLLNARLNFKLREAEVLRSEGSKMHFWFQTDDPASGKRVNYAFTAVDLLDGMDSRRGFWRSFEMVLTGAEKDWTCLGSNVGRTSTYGCAASVREVLSKVTLDFGFIFLPVKETKPVTGAVDIDDFQLWVAVSPSSGINTKRVSSEPAPDTPP